MSQPANDDYSQHLSDDEASYHEEASDSGTATNKPKQQQQQLTPTTTTISNIKLLNSEEGGKRISTGKDGVVRILPPVSAAEIHAVENERKARIILLKAIPKEHLRRFHGMDDAKEIWEAIRIRFGGNANSKKMQKALTFQANEIYAKDEKLKRYRRIGMKAVKEKEQLKKTVDSWKDSSKNLWKLIDSGIEFLLGKLLRPIDRNTAKMSYFNAVKGNWGTTVKTTAGYNWRNSRPNSNYDSGPTFIRTVNAKGSSTQEHGGQRFKSGRPMLILIVDFLKGTHIRYALEHNPTIYVSVTKQFWQTVTVITLDNGEQELKATIDTHEYTISESSVRNKLKRADENGITELTNAEIFEGMTNLGHPIDNTFMFWKKHFTPNWKFMVHHILHCISSKSGGWDQLGSKLATALILSKTTRRTYKVYLNDFEAMVGQSYQLTKKIFGNMNRGFAGVNRLLLANMIAGHDGNEGEPQKEPIESQPPPNASIPSTSQPTTEPHPDQELETETELYGSSSDFVHTSPTQVETSSPKLKSISPEPMEHTYDQPQPSPVQQPASLEPQPTSPPKSPPFQGPTSTYVEATQINVADLLHLVPQLVTRIDHLEKELKEHKQTTFAVIVKLVKRVKKPETRVKYRNLPTRKMVLSDSVNEDAANSSKQGRNLGEEDVFETHKGKDSGETDISPSGLQAAETLVQVASQKTKTYTRRVKSGLKKKLDVGVSSGDRKFKSASEEIKSGFTNISSGEVRVSQRKGKEVLEEQPQPKRSKKQIREEEASLVEIARIQAQEAAEIERKAELQRLDALAAKRLNDEFEMSEQQRKRAAEVQQQAQYYTEEDWDLIRARMEASTELRKSVFGTDIDAEDYAKKMVELVEKRRREIREQKLKAKKNKPMTQAEQRNYMMNYVRSQSHGWTIPQLKKLSFEELKVQFERTIRSIENFIPMDSEKEKESLKRSGETLQGAEKKKQKVLDVEDIPIPESAKFVKEEEIEVKQPVLKMSRRKSKARKGIGLHTSTEPESGEVDITSSKIVKWKILRHGGKGYCHLIRANQRDSVFVNFGAMLHNISRDDLVDLYKIVLQKTTAYGPEEDLERAFAENLRIMFDPPQSEDTVWSLPMHIPIVNWRYYDSCNVHCLNLHNTTAIYMLAERSYPLSEEVCRMMLKKKLFAQNTEVKKKLVKSIEKKAGIKA
ncbi:hypothetical protein Tco_0005873 [Tanacetum coccineum]